MYRSAIRRSRDRDGTSLYIVPTMGLGFRPVPGRCAGEERAALASAMRGRPAREVSAALSGQERYLAWQQYSARHPQAICLAEIDHKPAGSRIGGAGGLACGWDVAMIEQGLAGLGTEDSAASPPLFHGIVPDDVARVRLELPAHAGVRTATPVNNVYLARLPRGVNAPARVVWQAADGSVIRTTRVP